MRFEECHEGDYRIYVGALEAPRGEGFTAAVVVKRVRGAGTPEGGHGHAAPTAYRDDSVACGYRWPSADEAMAYAMQQARNLVRRRSSMLAC
jgi:hypothetical protein